MFTVIIADDEMRICALLEKSIRWNELGLRLVGTASSGSALLEAVREKLPDIVITDIQMPGINGIDAIRAIRECSNKCKIIIISGYQKFAYAHNALKYNVNDYLLKPIDAEELNESLRNITLELSAEAGSRSSADSAGTAAGSREHFISVLLPLLSKRGYGSLDAVNRGYGTKFTDGIFQGMYLYIDTGRDGPDIGSLNSLIGKLHDMCGKMLGDVCSDVLFAELGNGLLIGINYTPGTDIPHLLQQMFDKICPVINLFAGFGLTIGIGEAVGELSLLSRSLEHAQEIIRYRSAIGHNRLIFWDAVKTRIDAARSVKELDDSIVPVERAIEACSPETFEKAYGSFLSDLSERRALTNLLFIERVCDAFSDFIENGFAGCEKTAFIKSQLEFEFVHCSDIPSLAAAVSSVITTELGELKKHLMDKENLPIRRAKEYIYKNYSHPIRLEDIASAVYLSPAYLSNVFKKATGENIVNFINGYRVQQAKKLLVSTNMTVEEIAAAVGFDSHRYFGNVFKKTMGIKPSEYRKLYQ